MITGQLTLIIVFLVIYLAISQRVICYQRKLIRALHDRIELSHDLTRTPDRDS
jgi:hypothetical protein